VGEKAVWIQVKVIVRKSQEVIIALAAVAEVIDKINDRWGEFVITPALMMGLGDIILDRKSFGGVKELEEIYSD
jgi:hypothetical protein